MNHSIFLKMIGLVIILPIVTTGCATTDRALADGRNVRAVMAAQIDDTSASERHGTATPQGTDAEISASSVEALRQRGAQGASKPGLFESLLGILAGK
ncbi:MAG: hypothetical protein ACO3FH_10250 [Steroidobacteraceae bacterium]